MLNPMRATPVFQPVFGEDRPYLSQVLQRRYANRPYTRDMMSVEGGFLLSGPSGCIGA
jgi:hypothetical protein